MVFSNNGEASQEALKKFDMKPAYWPSGMEKTGKWCAATSLWK